MVEGHFILLYFLKDLCIHFRERGRESEREQEWGEGQKERERVFS